MSPPSLAVSRRHFLTAGALAAAAPVLASAPAAVPHDVGRKFNADGTVRPFGGNTFIGHIAQQGAGYKVFDALLTMYREAPAHAFARKLALTPPSSYHVTVFGGLNDEDQGRPRWPRALPPGLSLGAVTQRWLRELQSRPGIDARPFEFAFGQPDTMVDGAPHLPLHPANDATAQRLAALRDELSALTGIRDKDHARYAYHMTFGYLFQLLSSGEAQALQAATADWVDRIAARAGTLSIPAVQFCSLRDMYAFRVLHAL